MGRNVMAAAIACGIGATCLFTSPASAVQDRVSATEKGSLLVYSKVEVRWDSAGTLVQDTFISLINDYPQDVNVLAYFVHGDAPEYSPCIDGSAQLLEPGWDWVDVNIPLTKNEPSYWSAATGLPKGVSPWTILDPVGPGRLAKAGDGAPGDRVLRGFIVLWAVNMIDSEEIRWDHLAGSATLVNYREGYAWEYNAWAHQVVDVNIVHGAKTGTPGILNLNNVEYAPPFGILLLDFYSYPSNAFNKTNYTTSINTDLTLHPASLDVRLNSTGPVTTSAVFEVWDQNEIKRSNTTRCITCWDQQLISLYENPNSLLKVNLQTDKGKARIDGLANQDCDEDLYGPGGLCTEPDGVLDVISRAEALYGLAAKHITINGLVTAAAGGNMVGMATENATIQYSVEIQGPPPSATDPDGMIDDLKDTIDQALKNQSSLPTGNLK